MNEREIIIIIADHKTYGVETIEVKMPKRKVGERGSCIRKQSHIDQMMKIHLATVGKDKRK